MNRFNFASPSSKNRKSQKITATLRRCSLVSLFAIAIALLPSAVVAQEADANLAQRTEGKREAKTVFTGQQLNTLISQEATENLVSLLGINLGEPVAGTWSGTVTDSGWQLTFTGSIAGQATQITENGTLGGKKGNDASWSDSGAVGTTSVSGSGTATYAGGWLTWTQDVQGGSQGSIHSDLYFYDPVATFQEEQCYTYGPKSPLCIAAENYSFFKEWGPETNYTVATHLDLQTGFFFSSGDVENAQLTTIHVGYIDFSTGSIAYSVSSFTPQGTGL